MPRNSFKSSVLTVGGCLWILKENPNARILIVSGTQKNAFKFFKEIKTHIEANEKLRTLFGKWNAGSTRWREDEITLSTRTEVKKEPSLMYSSLEKQVTTSLHFSHIVLDDVVSQLTINTEEQIQKTINYYKFILSVLDPDGALYILGTRYSALDLYGYILENEASEYEVLCKSAYDELGNPLMPSVLSKDFLEKQRKAQGDYIFATQYLNQTLNSASIVFKKEDIQFYEKAPINLELFMSVDPAITGGLSSDYSGIIVLGVDPFDHWYSLIAKREKLTILHLVDEILRLIVQFKNINALLLERFNIEKVMGEILRKEMHDRNIQCPIKEVQTNNRVSKEARIKSLQPIVESKRIHIKRDQEDLYSEFCNYPQVRHDDLLDTFKNFVGNTFPAKELKNRIMDGMDHLSENEKQVWIQCKKLEKRRVRRWTPV